MAKIKVKKNGPYEVSGSVPLADEKIVFDNDGFPYKWQKGKQYPLKKEYKLCRCGRSKEKPFCDGNHKGFDGTETAGKLSFKEETEVIEGPKMILEDADPYCVHAGFCDRAGSIWELVKKDDPLSKKIAIEEASNCPSGRLVLCDKSGHEIEPKLKPSISVTEVEGIEGPLWVKGGIPVESAEGKEYEIRNRVTLCRCGRSQNKPLCDGSHLH